MIDDLNVLKKKKKSTNLRLLVTL